MKNTPKNEDKTTRSNNPDAITGEPGSHPVGTGVGALAGGAATGAVVGTVAGPIGTAVGAAVGAIAGGLAGKGVAESMNPTAEDAYWRENHSKQPYAKNRAYADYGPAYRNGYEGYAPGESFEGHEADLRKKYETGSPKIDWSDARFASQAAWQRRQAKSTEAKR